MQTLVASVQVLTKALADLQSSFARMGGKLPPSATAVVPLKPKAKRKPKGNKPRAPESPNVPPAPAPARQEPAADTFAAVVRAGLKNKPTAPPTVPFRLAPQGWDLSHPHREQSARPAGWSVCHPGVHPGSP